MVPSVGKSCAVFPRENVNLWLLLLRLGTSILERRAPHGVSPGVVPWNSSLVRGGWLNDDEGGFKEDRF